MRIISQDGIFDLPYEQAAVTRLDEKVIAYPFSDLESTDYIQLASYSTKEKAIKAMEMCRERYAHYLFNKGMIPAAADNLVKIPLETADKIKDQISGTFIFKFPADEEV